MKQKVYPIEMEIAGAIALFSRPDSGDSIKEKNRLWQ